MSLKVGPDFGIHWRTRLKLGDTSHETVERQGAGRGCHGSRCYHGEYQQLSRHRRPTGSEGVNDPCRRPREREAFRQSMYDRHDIKT